METLLVYIKSCLPHMERLCIFAQNDYSLSAKQITDLILGSTPPLSVEGSPSLLYFHYFPPFFMYFATTHGNG